MKKIKKTSRVSFGYLLSPYFFFKDKRGKFLGIVRGHKWEEINFVESVKGCVRGNHYHKKTTECFYIIEGKIKATLFNLKNKRKNELLLGGGDILMVKPNVWHSFEISENSKWINMLSKAMDERNKDFYKLKL